MIPIGHDRQVTRRLPLLTITLIALNFLIFIVQASVGPQQDTALDKSFEKLIEFSIRHPESKMSKDALDRVSRLPEWHVQKTRKELEQSILEHRYFGIDEQNQAPLVLNDSTLINKEMQRLSAAFVEAYDDNWSLKFGFIPSSHKNSPLNYLTSIFMHGGWEHLIGNMVCLFVVGIAMEDTWGGLFYLLFYLMSGFVATLTHGYSSPDSKIVCVGASGAIAGVMGAFLVRHFKSRFKLFIFVAVIRVPAYVYLPFMIAYDLKNSFRVQTSDMGGVAFWAHIGGFLFGAIVSFIVYYSGFEKFLEPKKSTKLRSFGTGNAVSEARDHLERDELDEAFRKLNQRLEAFPKDQDAIRVLAQAYAAKNDRSSEIKTYHRLIRVCMQEKKLDVALNAYCELLETYSENEAIEKLPPREWMAICEYLKEQNMLTEAAGEYEKMARAYSGEWLTAQLLANAADCRLKLLDYEYARELYKSAYEHSVTNPALLMQISENLIQIENILRNRDAA